MLTKSKIISVSELRSKLTVLPDFEMQRWSVSELESLFELPLNDLVLRAHLTHRDNFDANEVQLSTLLSIKTGGCSEDCGYCPQSSHYDTGLKAEKLMALDEVVDAAARAKELGATRFCMGAAWRSPKAREMDRVVAMIREVKALGLETCMTLGMLDARQACELKDAGLDYYNHNLDSAPEFYGQVVSTRSYQDRLDTIKNVRAADLKVCSGGIVGMGESRSQRAGLLAQLANMQRHPESVPINQLVPVTGTPMEGLPPIDPFEFVRTIAVARVTMPRTVVRLSAGREQMDDALQALCFFAGANSIFFGDRLLTTSNPQIDRDLTLLDRLGMHVRRSDSELSMPKEVVAVQAISAQEVEGRVSD